MNGVHDKCIECDSDFIIDNTCLDCVLGERVEEWVLDDKRQPVTKDALKILHLVVIALDDAGFEVASNKLDKVVGKIRY